MDDDVLISTRVLGLCLRNWNYPLADHTHVCGGMASHPTGHRCRCGAEPGECCPPEFRCICDPNDPFEPPDPTPRVVPGCPAHRARGAYQRWATENARAAESTKDGTEGGAAC